MLSSTLRLWAQTTFDVASVKPKASGDPPSAPAVSRGRFSWTNATLRQLIQIAYDRRPHQLIGMPDWAGTARFDVSATTNPGTSPQQMNVMLQSLLADRFDLLVHRDNHELPVYSLVVARRDGRLGPGIRPAAVDCEDVTTHPLDGGNAQSNYSGCTPQMGLTRLKAPGFRMATLASALMRLFDRSIIDKTGVSGAFDIELTWIPDPTMLPNGVPAPTNATGASIFTALEEQLGLKLLSDRGPVDVLVIDHLSRSKPD
jgi:uncharacterized protein (TIGR03435 family)